MKPDEQIILDTINSVHPDPLPVHQPGQPLIDIYNALSARGIITFTPDPENPHSYTATVNKETP